MITVERQRLTGNYLLLKPGDVLNAINTRDLDPYVALCIAVALGAGLESESGRLWLAAAGLTPRALLVHAKRCGRVIQWTGA